MLAEAIMTEEKNVENALKTSMREDLSLLGTPGSLNKTHHEHKIPATGAACPHLDPPTRTDALSHLGPQSSGIINN